MNISIYTSLWLNQYSVESAKISLRKFFHFCVDISSPFILSQYLWCILFCGAGGRAALLGTQLLQMSTTHPGPGLQTPCIFNRPLLRLVHFSPNTSCPLLTTMLSSPMPFTLPEIPYLPIFSQRNPSPSSKPSSQPVSTGLTRTITSHAPLPPLSHQHRAHWCNAAGAVIYFFYSVLLISQFHAPLSPQLNKLSETRSHMLESKYFAHCWCFRFICWLARIHDILW